MNGITVGVAIPTHNRLHDLQRTLEALGRLEPQPDEIWVCMDGCTDGTEEFVREHHPGVRVIVNEKPIGSVPSRNALARACSCDVMITLDDDSYPLEADFISRVRDLFRNFPKIAVASFPQRSDEFPESLHAQSFGSPMLVSTYVSCSAAIRRSVFQDLGGYAPLFFHAYEEPDFALRCMAKGWQIRWETSLTIRHHYSGVQRNELRTHHRHARNELWSVFLRCPLVMIPPIALFRLVRQFRYALSRGWQWAWHEPEWWRACLLGIPQCLRERRAVSWRSYWRWLKLKRQPLEAEPWVDGRVMEAQHCE